MSNKVTTPSTQPTSFGEKFVRVITQDTVGGILLLTATALALVLANSPLFSGYESVRDFTFGIEA
jgi:NhaA family Na+:H+ antiporter